MDWYDLFLIFIGAILGFVFSILTTIINKAIDKQGKIKLFYKLVYQKETSKIAGICSAIEGDCLIIPMYFEFQNTSNTARVIRDVCLYLYKDGKQVAKMNQLQYTKRNNGKNDNNEIINFGGDKNSYSFVLPPMSIQKQECEFAYLIPPCKKDDYIFDQIRFSYYDEKDRVMECVFCNAEHGWQEINFNYENEYIQLKCHRRQK